MRNQAISAPVICALALVIALDCISTCDKPQQQHRAAPAHLVKCAEASEGALCWPDPGMLRLEMSHPLPLRPAPKAEPPQITPPR